MHLKVGLRDIPTNPSGIPESPGTASSSSFQQVMQTRSQDRYIPDASSQAGLNGNELLSYRTDLWLSYCLQRDAHRAEAIGGDKCEGLLYWHEL